MSPILNRYQAAFSSPFIASLASAVPMSSALMMLVENAPAAEAARNARRFIEAIFKLSIFFAPLHGARPSRVGAPPLGTRAVQ